LVSWAIELRTFPCDLTPRLVIEHMVPEWVAVPETRVAGLRASRYSAGWREKTGEPLRIAYRAPFGRGAPLAVGSRGSTDEENTMISRILAILAILAVSACGDDDDSAPANVAGSSPGGAASTGGSAGAGGVSPTGGAGGGGGAASTACATCAMTNCATSALACYADTECQAILNCAMEAGCQDEACVNSCVAQNPNGATLATPALTCVQTNCAAECLG